MIKHSRPGYLKMTERLETLIASGSYRAGDKLPGLRALSEEFDLTTYAVHEGLKSLHRKGVLILRHGSGASQAERSGAVLAAGSGVAGVCPWAKETQQSTAMPAAAQSLRRRRRMRPITALMFDRFDIFT